MNKTLHQLYVGLFFLVGISATLLLAYNGYNYYSLPIEERFFDAKDFLLKPSGSWGHLLGILGSLMMIFGVSIYIIRKRVKRFVRSGGLKYWLELHIFLCTVGPILVLFHTSFKFGGIVSVSFWSMVAVVLSGVIGRFIYVQIPRSIQGRELDISELEEINLDFNRKLRNDYQLDEKTISDFETLFSNYRDKNIIQWLKGLPKDKIKSKMCIKKLKNELLAKHLDYLKIKEIVSTVKSKISFSRKISMLNTMQNLFRYWHIFHLPFAITMFIIMVVHVGVTITFGYRWIF